MSANQLTSQSTFADAVERLAADEPQWLGDARRAALAAYESAALPDRAQHLWRYTDPGKLMPGKRALGTPGDTFGELPEDYHDGTFEHVAGLAISRDGRMLRAVVDSVVADRGVVLSDIRDAAREHESIVRKHLLALTQTDLDKFEALSTALFQGGTFIHVPRGVELDRPLRIAHRVGSDDLHVTRSLVVIEENAEATLVFDLSTMSPDDAALLHSGVEVHVGAGARFRLVFIQSAGRKFVQAPVIRCRVERDASLETVTVALGGALVKSQQTTESIGQGASVRVLGIIFADRRQHMDHHTLQDHLVGHNSSDLDFRSVIAHRARSAYTGNLRIGLDGEGANAHQRNHNLLLHETARADTIPELEILTNDVTCSHAAAVGPLDDEMVHFCNSRGLSPAQARRVIIAGFLEPVVTRIPGEDLQERVRNALATRLEAAS
jgi:Fe-S cluster assembly protein SufD